MKLNGQIDGFSRRELQNWEKPFLFFPGVSPTNGQDPSKSSYIPQVPRLARLGDLPLPLRELPVRQLALGHPGGEDGDWDAVPELDPQGVEKVGHGSLRRLQAKKYGDLKQKEIGRWLNTFLVRAVSGSLLVIRGRRW